MRTRSAPLLVAFLVAACDHDPLGRCDTSLDCLDGQVCAEGVCTAAGPGPANHPPAAAADAYAVATDALLSIPAAAGVLVNDADADGDPLAAERVASPLHGTVFLSPDGAFVYVPHPGFAGDDGFTYRASDGALRSGVTSVTVTVGP